MKKKPSRPVIIQNISCICKKNVKYDKNQINLLFFCEKPVSSQQGHNKFFLKNFGTPIPFIPLTPIMSYLTCN